MCPKKLGLLLFLVLFLLQPKFLLGQTQVGGIQGSVQDADSQPIPGANITTSSTSLIGGSAVTFTNEQGYYHFPALLPGVYEVKVELQGFQTAVRRDIRVAVGTTITIDFALQMDGRSERVTVVGESPLIDVTTTATSFTVPAEVVQNLPKPNSITALLALTPGVGDDLVAYGASGEPDNRIWIDGVDINSPLGGFLYAQYDYNWIEEAQVTGIGAPAEYGGYTGVVGNFVTRSGGNEFHGLFETFFQNEKLVSTNTPNPGPESPFKTYDLSTQLGGPILNNKLWFFSGFEYPYTQKRPFGYDGVTTQEYTKFITKLTYKPNQNNIIQGFGHWNYLHLDGEGASASVLPEATSIVKGPEASWNATWISLLSPQTTFEARFGGFWASTKTIPRNGDIPNHYDAVTGISSGNALKRTINRRFRPQVNLSFSHHAEQYLGSHDFKFGVQIERSHAEHIDGYSGGMYYYDYHGPYARLVSPPPGSDAQDTIRFVFDDNINRTSSYAEDSWSVNDRLTLSLGLRWDHNRGVTDRGTVFKTDPVAPRLGFVWKFKQNYQTVLKAHYGDYYEALIATSFGLLSDADRGLALQFFNSETGEWETALIERFVASAEAGLKHPFVRQFTAGIDQELPGGIVLGGHYIHRRWKNILQDINVSARYEPVSRINPITQETITVFNLIEGGDAPTLLTNPPGLFRTYNGVEVIANRRFSDKLALSASFIYSKITGNVPNEPDEFGVFTPLLNDPNTTINFTGRLVNDPTIAWKIVGTYTLPWGFNAGWFFRHQSGDTWTPSVRVLELNQGPVRILGLPLGSNRLPSTNLLDLRVEKQFPLYKGQLRFAVDIFNVFNRGYVTNVDALFWLPTFGMPTSFTDPRTIRLGLRYSF